MSVVGCASLQIAPGERPSIPPNEGVLAIAIANQSLVYLDIVGDGASFSISPYVGPHLYTYHLPAGRYCVQQLRYVSSAAVMDPEPCIEVAAGAVTLTGFVASNEEVTAQQPEPNVRALFVERHPELAKAFSEKRFVEIPFGTTKGVPLD